MFFFFGIILIMSNLIDIDKLIKQAKKEGVDLGRGDPYNRLRYFTKIGWLPHMTRKKVKGGDVKGHYPSWVLERLELIDSMKKQGATNEQISSKINTRNKLHGLYARLNSPDFRNKMISYITVVIVFVILLNELDLINLSKSKNQTINTYAEDVPTHIADAGVSFVPANKNRVFIRNSDVSARSKVYVTFNQNFSPAARFWVSEIEPQRGFYVELDAPVFDNAEFSWWISN